MLADSTNPIPALPTFSANVKFGSPSPRSKRERLRGRFPLLLCDKCGESRVERRMREGLLQLLLSGFGFYPHKCRKCNVRQQRLIFPYRFVGGIVMTLAALVASLYFGGVFRRLKPESRPPGLTALGSEDTYYSARVASTQMTPFERILAARKKQVLRNEDVILMLHSGIERDVVLKLIKTANAAYDISPGGILELRSAGADNTVVLAMIDRLTSIDANGPR